eukprot:221266_1
MDGIGSQIETDRGEHRAIIDSAHQLSLNPSAKLNVEPRDGEKDYGETLSRYLSDNGLPFADPNAETDEQIVKYVNGERGALGTCCSKAAQSFGCCLLPVVGWCYMASQLMLVEEGHLQFTLKDGVPYILSPGWHYLPSVTHKFGDDLDMTKDHITAGPVTIVTVSEGQYGFAVDNGRPVILRPGRHVRNSAVFEFIRAQRLTDKLISFGPITIVTVETGEVGIGNKNGFLMEMPAGYQYMINSTQFKFESHLRVKQRLKRFEEIRISTQDGVQMTASGLLTYQLTHIEKLIAQVEIKELEPHIERITRGALVNLFTRFPLKEIMQAADISNEHHAKPPKPLLKNIREEQKLEGAEDVRSHICEDVADEVQKMTEAWGVDIIRFQLQSLLFYDKQFARDYENSTLQLATTEVEARSADITNRVKIKNAEADAEALRISSEGRKVAAINQAGATNVSMIRVAEAEAKAIELKAVARNKAADCMTHPLAQQLALLDSRKQIVKSSALRSLTIMGENTQASILLPVSGGNDFEEKE